MTLHIPANLFRLLLVYVYIFGLKLPGKPVSLPESETLVLRLTLLLMGCFLPSYLGGGWLKFWMLKFIQIS